MTIALPVSTPATVATLDERHYTPWQPKPIPAGVARVVVNSVGQTVSIEDPGTVAAHQFYTEWRPKPRP